MKMKLLVLGAALVLVAGVGIARAAWRAHRQLVTLRVRNMPLGQVISKLERQTRQRIRFDHKLDAKVTLDVKNKPLPDVLDSVSEQAGARWGRTYAVYSNPRALVTLEQCLESDSDLEAAGWTNVAPRFDGSLPQLPTELGSAGPGKITMTQGPHGTSPEPGKPTIRVDEDVVAGLASTNTDSAVRTLTRRVNGPGNETIINAGPGTTTLAKEERDSSAEDHKMKVIVRRVAGPGGVTTTVMDGNGRVKVTRTSADGQVLKEDRWSSQRLVIEHRLTSQLGDAIPSKATPDTAAQAATRVHGKYVTYFTLDKPPIPGGETMNELVRSTMKRVRREPGPALEKRGDIPAQVEADAAQRRLDELSASPEQQVQRARQKQQAQSPQ